MEYGNSGFAEKAVRNLPEIQAVLYEMEHSASGAKLVWLKRAEENRTFGIAFTTLPWDDSGVFHILEHSVLCGSKNYPVKEPFAELMKHSMNTFLNAMTYPDKTFFPISSRSEKDFLNLMQVYLDAVFHPNIYTRPEIFQQEGWHYAFDEQGNITCQGVVLNEMKGAFADADQQLYTALTRLLFPDSPYRFVAGGEPSAIPSLSYEAFLDAHSKYYTPSNSCIFLDGDIPIDAALSLIDASFCGLAPGKRIAPPAQQKPTDGGTRELFYEIAPDEHEESRIRIAWGLGLCSFADRRKIVGMEILANVLCGSSQAPLKRAILSQNLAEDVQLEVITGTAQPWVRLELRNVRESDRAQAEHVLFAELHRLAEDGMNHDLILAAMTQTEFVLRERDYGNYPQGIIFGMQVLESWLYGGQPEANLICGTLFDTLRAGLGEGYFESLLREVFLDNPHRCRVTLIPSHTAGEVRRWQEHARLTALASNWSAHERQSHLNAQDALLRRQQQADTREQLDTLPRLRPEDIPREPEELPILIREHAGIPILYHPLNCGGIVYITLYFDAGSCDEEELSLLSFLCGLLGELDTASHTALELKREIQLLCGTLSFRMEAYASMDTPECCSVKLCAAFSALDQNMPEAIALVSEILTSSRMDDEGAIHKLMRQKKSSLSNSIIMAGHQIALIRLESQISAAGTARDAVSGFSFLQWLKRQDEEWNFEQLQSELIRVMRKVVAQGNLTLSIAGESELHADAAASALQTRLPVSEAAAPAPRIAPTGQCREGIVIPADVGFAIQGGDLRTCGSSFSGTMQLAGKILSLDYLWDRIRVQGGAYGCGLVIRPTGLCSCYSCRDPNGNRSLEEFTGCGEFLRKFAGENTDLCEYMIGAVSDDSPLLTPRQKAEQSDRYYWRGIIPEQRRNWRKELLQTSPNMLLEAAAVLEQVIAGGGSCIIGSQTQVKDCTPERIYFL